ncbi:MAG TPA: NMD3-related protein [Candidatus Nanoarchaeia archaeon]|nr:NMD3-related protein [Candidatus Nanoarchaeia archaeon]
MDFCVKCGNKDVYQDFLCRQCHAQTYPEKEKKIKKKSSGELRHANYFEATVQLRNVSKEVMRFAYDDVEKNGIVISKEIKMDNGVDFFVDSRKYAQQLGKKLQHKFGGMIKSSARVFTKDRQTSKDVYRVTIMFKQFPYKKGEKFMLKGEELIVKAVGTDVITEDSMHRQRRIKFVELERLNVF